MDDTERGLRELDAEGLIGAKLACIREQQAAETLRPPPDPVPVPRPRRDSYSTIRRTASGSFLAPAVPVVRPPTDAEWDAFCAACERAAEPATRPVRRSR